MRVVGVDVGRQGGHAGRHPRAQVLGGKAVEVPEVRVRGIEVRSHSRHGLVDRLYPISQGKFIHYLFVGLLEVDLPALLPLGVRQTDLAIVLLAEVVEQVLVETGVLDVVRRHLG